MSRCGTVFWRSASSITPTPLQPTPTPSLHRRTRNGTRNASLSQAFAAPIRPPCRYHTPYKDAATNAFFLKINGLGTAAGTACGDSRYFSIPTYFHRGAPPVAPMPLLTRKHLHIPHEKLHRTSYNAFSVTLYKLCRHTTIDTIPSVLPSEGHHGFYFPI